MMICIQNLVLFCQFVLKILSKNQFLTSIKGRNSFANLRKTKIYNTNIDLVNDNVYTKFGLNRSIRFQDIEQKLNSDVNQGQITLLQICRNSNSSKLSCMSSIPAKMKKIKLKMKAVDCSQDFSHYKSMGIFPDAQGQLTPQSLVRSGRISNSSELLWMSSLPASMKKIRSKMKALEWTQHFPHYNSMVAMETSGRIWPNFELIQALIHVLITCKYEKNPIKNSGENVMTLFFPL